MPIYKKATGVWRVRILHSGKTWDRIVRGARDEAVLVEAEMLRQVASTAPRFSAFIADHYRPHAKLRLKPSWWVKQVYILANLVEHLGGAELTAITTETIETYARSRLDAGLRASSVNNEIRVLRRVLAFAVEQGQLAAVPKFRALPERGGRSAHAWSSAELDTLLAKTPPKILPLVMFLANTGCRKGEAIALKWEHVDLAARLVKVWPSDEWQPKSGKPREVPISDALLPWLEQQRKATTGRWVFPVPKAKIERRYSHWPDRDFDAARDAAGLKGGPHTLRHTYATHFLARVPDLYLLARILGHSDAAVTRLYAHLLPDHLARARNAVSVSAGLGPAQATAMARWQSGRGLENEIRTRVRTRKEDGGG